MKNTKRPDGSATPWAYYMFRNGPGPTPPAQARAQPDGRCFACHEDNGLVDHVWVQFYPILRKHIE